MVRLGHVHLPVSDLARSIEFYRDSLGFQIGYQDETMAVVDTIGVLLDQAEDLTEIGAGVVVGLRVEDVDTEYQRLIDRGVAIESGPEER